MEPRGEELKGKEGLGNMRGAVATQIIGTLLFSLVSERATGLHAERYILKYKYRALLNVTGPMVTRLAHPRSLARNRNTERLNVNM